MLRNKYMIGGGIVLAIILVFGGGFWLGNRDNKPAQKKAAQSGQASNNVIPLGQEEPENSGGLQVNTGSATSLGQLDFGQKQASGSSDAAAANSPAPGEFAEYEKYKNDQHALFGEIKAGTGAELTSGKKATVSYKGWLTDGRQFDESRSPYIFTMGAKQVIPGFEEGTYGMKAGGSRLLIIPPAVGYGAAGQGNVPGNAVLVFQVQLQKVE
jgi:FKBP-type peptidyl-prolyl cis-trans isomerase FkpA